MSVSDKDLLRDIIRVNTVAYDRNTDTLRGTIIPSTQRLERPNAVDTRDRYV